MVVTKILYELPQRVQWMLNGSETLLSIYQTLRTLSNRPRGPFRTGAAAAAVQAASTGTAAGPPLIGAD
jgi:hypothetical protein